jgi:hypothetical protein
MEIGSLKNYKKAFELLKIVVIVIIICGFASNVAIYLLCQKQSIAQKKIVYFVDNTGDTKFGKAVSASSVREIQIKAAIKKAYTLWYQIDEGSYHANIEEALYYFGDCGKGMLKDYNDDRVGYNLKEKNLILTVVINDIKIDMISHKGYIEGVQTIRRDEGKVRRNIFAGFTFNDISPSDWNPFGVKIENWDVYNKDVLNQ